MSTKSKADALADLEAFYAATAPRLVGTLSMMCGSRDMAEEVVQEAFSRLVPRWDRVSRYDAPEAWVRLVAIRLIRTRHRRDHWPLLRGERADEIEEPTASATAPDGDLDMRAALSSIPVVYREVAVLFYVCDMPVEEIASYLKILSGTVKSRLARARAALAVTSELGAHHE